MNEHAKNGFRLACQNYLNVHSLDKLRSYGRFVGVSRPAAKKKETLIDDVISVLLGEIPAVPQSNRGAPVKNSYVDPEIITKIEALQNLYLADAPSDDEAFSLHGNGQKYLIVNDPSLDAKEEKEEGKRYCGQLETVNGASFLVPLNFESGYVKIVVPVELIRKYDLREGDVLTVYAESRPPVLWTTKILTVNDVVAGTLVRNQFSDSAVLGYPSEKIRFDGGEPSALCRYFEWLLPIGKGRRGVVVSEPKVGKTTLLAEMLRTAAVSNPKLELFAVFLEQSPENKTLFKNVLPKENAVWTSFEDDAERHVFVANCLLNRAKRRAEMGKDVLLVVDSLTALMRNFNETEESSGGKKIAYGIEYKTVHYVKNYLASARAFEKGGSLTILAALDKGNPVDDILLREVLSVANLTVFLDTSLTVKRIYPSVDIFSSRTDHPEKLLTEDAQRLERAIKTRFTKETFPENFFRLLEQSNSELEFWEKLQN